MSHPQELLEFWRDCEAGDWPVSQETVTVFQRHIDRLAPIADAGNDLARYAIASIHLLELLYPDEQTRENRIEEDREKMTQLLFQCAENGMVIAFDNLVVCGTGKIGESARAAAKAYERDQKPDWEESVNLPVYTQAWMEGAMNLWNARRGGQVSGVGPGIAGDAGFV